eukprot:6472238-Amphidinium_carterae.1
MACQKPPCSLESQYDSRSRSLLPFPAVPGSLRGIKSTWSKYGLTSGTSSSFEPIRLESSDLPGVYNDT